MAPTTIPPRPRPRRVLIPLPRRGFDPTETGAPWKMLRAGGVEVAFATPDGQPGQADPWMLEEGLTALAPFGPWLIADDNGRAAYRQMAESSAFRAPLPYGSIDPGDFDGLVLPGGHAVGMREYLESEDLRAKVTPFFTARKPIGAICHGVVFAARCTREDGRSVLEGYRTTALTEQMELFAWNLTRLLPGVGDYYRTYPETVEHEVTTAVGSGRFDRGPQLPTALALPSSLEALLGAIGTATTSNAFLKCGVFRDGPDSEGPAFTVEHAGHYLSARWPGDAFTFGKRFLALLNAAHAA